MSKSLIVSKMHNHSQQGFTLIELLIAVSIFSLVAAAAVGLFASAVGAQRKSLASQELLDQAGYALEYISRALRMARKELNCQDPLAPSTCSCLSSWGYGWNYEIRREGKGLRFVNYQGVCQEFFLEGGQLKQGKCKEEPCSSPEQWEILPLTGKGIQIEEGGFNINLLGPEQSQSDGSWDNQQPRVTISLRVKAAGLKPEAQPELKIQTTISQRELDIGR